MEKTESMIRTRKDDSTKKTRIAIDVIKSMVEANEKVTAKELVKRTGFSRAFFYANEAVHEAMLEAQEQQWQKRIQKCRKGDLDKTQPIPQKEHSSQRKDQPLPQKDVTDQMKEQQMSFLEQQNEKLRLEAEHLRQENENLKELIREQEEQLGQYL